ncbi:gliding motility protein GldM [Paradesertivirga mongoliensis]|uniref:Gliding motility protein GldM n=1 Tax=Paradesertivirga mongoliensis TaxID=2100740 RepID=A0ABW4ZH47_9SPHI|nr:gliding motility protein GldM [Pedobacter mongoliensis]
MAGGKESARQKMINIMYLVLLAMLALNVSDTILNAFKNINDSLMASTTNVEASISQLMTSFENTKLKEQPDRAKPLYDKAKQALAIGEDLNKYIENLKKEFTTAGQGIDPETGDLVERSNQDIAPGIMINQKKGAALKAKINETDAKLRALVDPKERGGLTFSLTATDPTERVNGVKKSWEEVNFGEGTPLTAAMTILSKIQTDVKNAESDVIKRLLGNLDKAPVILDKFSAVAVAPSSYIIAGQPYTAEVFLTAYDSQASPQITINGSNISVRDGKGIYNVPTSREGIFSYKGSITLRQADGTFKSYPLPEQKYQVSRPSAVVSPTAMNVFYIGVPNPVSISAPGIPKENLRVSMNGGSISGSNGNYTVRVSSAGTAKVNVSAEINGKVQSIGTQEFRVKRIPDPVPQFAGKTSGALSSVAIKSQNTVFAKLLNFDFDAKFTVTSFTLIIQRKGSDAQVLKASGSSLTPDMQKAMRLVVPGSRVFFEDVEAVGPDGAKRMIGAIALSAN